MTHQNFLQNFSGIDGLKDGLAERCVSSKQLLSCDLVFHSNLDLKVSQKKSMLREI